MEQKKLKEHIENIINIAFEKLQSAYNNNNEFQPQNPVEIGETRLVFPAYYEDGKLKEIRISEQELRFAFVEAFNQYCNSTKDCNLFYSVETPTKDKYSGFSKKNDEPKIDKNGRSAEFDLVIFDDNLKRICLIEFKANNANEHDHLKDFVKLNNKNEGGQEVLCYFIEVIKSYSEGSEKTKTVGSLEKKIEEKGKTIFRCYALEGKSSRKKDQQIKGEDISEKFK